MTPASILTMLSGAGSGAGLLAVTWGARPVRLRRIMPTRQRAPSRVVDRGTARLRSALARVTGRGNRDDAALVMVVALADGIVAELSAGAVAREALARCGAELPEGPVQVALSTVSTGSASPEAVLRALARQPGLGALGWLAAAWELSTSSGIPLASSISAIAASCRSDLAHRREVAARVAGARATTRLLAGLPVAGLLLGQSLGGDPWSVLVGTPPGWACLTGGVALEVVGLVWTRRLVAEAVAAA